MQLRFTYTVCRAEQLNTHTHTHTEWALSMLKVIELNGFYCTLKIICFGQTTNGGQHNDDSTIRAVPCHAMSCALPLSYVFVSQRATCIRICMFNAYSVRDGRCSLCARKWNDHEMLIYCARGKLGLDYTKIICDGGAGMRRTLTAHIMSIYVYAYSLHWKRAYVDSDSLCVCVVEVEECNLHTKPAKHWLVMR